MANPATPRKGWTRAVPYKYLRLIVGQTFSERARFRGRSAKINSAIRWLDSDNSQLDY
jgi:hypothetical protein